MSTNKSLSIRDASEPIKETKAIRDIEKENSDVNKIFEDRKPSFKSKNKTTRDIRKEFLKQIKYSGLFQTPCCAEACQNFFIQHGPD